MNRKIEIPSYLSLPPFPSTDLSHVVAAALFTQSIPVHVNNERDPTSDTRPIPSAAARRRPCHHR